MIGVDVTETKDDLQNFWRDPFKQWFAGGMPCYTQTATKYSKHLTVKFKTKEDREEFSKKMNYNLTPKTGFVFWPDKNREANMTKRYVLEDKNDAYLPKYPIYIISKGRWESRHTARALESMGIPYYIAVEPQEYDNYCSVIDPKKVLKLPFSNHGKGSGPARNWCWEHSIENGFDRHWLLDDNIGEFWRLHQNKRYRVQEGGSLFSSTEDFVDRYENIALSSLQYKFFAIEGETYPPYILNTRVMSCILIQNKIGIRWRGRYNEDVDLSIRVLKEGLCTALFYHGLCGKLGTGTVKGGNTTEIYDDYADDASLKKSQMLYEAHPDCVSLVERYGRTHHKLDLGRIINKFGLPARQNVPILIDDVPMLNKTDNRGMQLAEKWDTAEQFINYDFSVLRYPEGRKNGHE